METASAKEQVLALKEIFDDLRTRFPPTNIPGLKQLLDAQSEMIERIAESVGVIETRAREYDDIGREVLGKPIYIRTRSPREVLADARTAAIEALAKLDEQIASNRCHGITAEEESLCDEQHPRINAAIERAMQSAQAFFNLAEGQRQVLQYIDRRLEKISSDYEQWDAERRLYGDRIRDTNQPNPNDLALGAASCRVPTPGSAN